MKPKKLPDKSFLFAVFPVAFAPAQSQEMLTVQAGENVDVRALAALYLDDPNLWEEILKANRLASPLEIKPGMALLIPRDLIQSANAELESARQAIGEATNSGASVFASRQIARADSFYNLAISSKQESQWEESRRLASLATQHALQALSSTDTNRNVSGEAVLTDRGGQVENRKPAESLWQNMLLHARLVESDYVRTLSNSFAEITFNEENRIRLNENSLAQIQQNRVDRLEQKKESNVSLVRGDAFALLAGNPKKKKFDLDITGVETEVNSRKFWVKKDENVTRFANYDGELKVTAQNSTVIIGENQGSIIGVDKSPSAPKNLLKSPSVISPSPKKVVHDKEILFQWSNVAGANHYWLEISKSKSFKNLVVNQREIKTNVLAIPGLTEDSYYWRVAAVDADGLPGPFSERGFFYVVFDSTAPYLLVNAPEEGELFRSSSTAVSGESEKDVAVSMNGEAVDILHKGEFNAEYNLRDGTNDIIVEAKDPAGNIRQISRKVVYVADADIEIFYDTALLQTRPKHFLSTSPNVTFSGTTRPHSSVLAKALTNPLRMRAFADSDGNFRFPMSGLPDSTVFALYVVTPAGYTREDTVVIQVDHNTPEIALSSDLPPVTSNAALLVTGQVYNSARLTLNNREIAFSGESFRETVLLNPGLNSITLLATSPGGMSTALTKLVTLDNEPPALLNYNIRPETSAGGSSVYIEIKAQDNSGLRRTAKYIFQIGGAEHTGYLKFDKTLQTYAGVVKIWNDEKGDFKLKSAILEDYFGNRKEYQLK